MTQPITADLVKSWLPLRGERAGKWSFGRAMLVCGSADMPGAALLSAESALRSGAGLVQLASAEPVLHGAKIRLPECLLLTLPMDGEGHISRSAAPLLLDQGKKAQSLLFGCGLGLSPEGRPLLEAIAGGFSGAVVIDADGLNTLAGELSPLKKLAGRCVLTPHEREFCRLAGLTLPQLAADPAGLAASFAARYQVVVALKGAETLVTDGKRIFSLSAPNSGMAKGGSGDVLAGLLCGLLAQCPQNLLELTGAAVWLHSQAGLLARRNLGPYSMLPRDVLGRLPMAFRLTTEL